MTLCVFGDASVCRVCNRAARHRGVFRECRVVSESVRVSSVPAQHKPVQRGPGTELAKLLGRFGIEPTPTCQCRAKAAEMNAWGPDECERPERIDEVVAVMRAEAAARGLPFLDSVGRMLVRRAISNARRSA